MQLLFIDVETGGLDPASASLLSVGLVIWDDGVIKAKTEVFVKYEFMKISPEAISVNKINLLEHLEKSVYPDEAVKCILDFCHTHLLNPPPWVIGGHNIYFDLGFLQPFFKSQNYEWHEYFSHRSLDTASILRFLFLAGMLDKEVVSSNQAFKHFNIKVEGRHTALGDALATAELFNQLLLLVRSKSL